MLTSLVIQSQIDALTKDEGADGDPEQNISDMGLRVHSELKATIFDNVSIDAAEKPCTFHDLEKTHQGDLAFVRFRLRFATFLDKLLRWPNSPVYIDNNQ
jgi:hypothetical protein